MSLSLRLMQSRTQLGDDILATSPLSSSFLMADTLLEIEGRDDIQPVTLTAGTGVYNKYHYTIRYNLDHKFICHLIIVYLLYM